MRGYKEARNQSDRENIPNILFPEKSRKSEHDYDEYGLEQLGCCKCMRMELKSEKLAW